jgi:histidyl-tRNA synthetase
VEHSLHHQDVMPVRLSYIGPMFRYERPQKGRERQFFQIGVEAIGSASPLVDAEVILFSVEFYAGLGLEPELLLNSMGCAADRERFAPALRAFLEQHRDELCDDCHDRMQTNPLRVFDCKVPECQQVLRNEELPHVDEYLCDDCRTHFRSVQDILEALAVKWTTAPQLVRGMDYYTRTVFEFDMPALGARSAIGGGGRYDGLVEEFGGPSVPGVGMAVGVTPTMIAIKESRAVEGWRPDVYVVWLSAELAPIAMAAAADLRKAGRRVTLSDEARSIRSQLRAADRLGSRLVVILGPDEVSRGVAAVRDLGTGEQREVALTEVASL